MEKKVHQPEELMSFSGLIDETKSPKVGTVQTTAIIQAAADAIGELKMFFARPLARTEAADAVISARSSLGEVV